MAGELSLDGMGDALVILGAAGIVIPAFARLKINPVIGLSTERMRCECARSM